MHYTLAPRAKAVRLPTVLRPTQSTGLILKVQVGACTRYIWLGRLGATSGTMGGQLHSAAGQLLAYQYPPFEPQIHRIELAYRVVATATKHLATEAARGLMAFSYSLLK
jgi:hypothetical protein